MNFACGALFHKKFGLRRFVLTHEKLVCGPFDFIVFFTLPIHCIENESNSKTQ